MSYYYYYGDSPEEYAQKYCKLDVVVKSELEESNPRKEVVQQLEVHTSFFTSLITEAKDFATTWKKKLKDVRSITILTMNMVIDILSYPLKLMV